MWWRSATRAANAIPYSERENANGGDQERNLNFVWLNNRKTYQYPPIHSYLRVKINYKYTKVDAIIYTWVKF